MTQQELADYLGVGQGFISQMEKNGRRVPEKYISKILSDKSKDSSMVQIIDSDNSNNEVTMSREVFDKMSQLINTVCAQQTAISKQQETIAGQQDLLSKMQTLVDKALTPPHHAADTMDGADSEGDEGAEAVGR